MTTVGLHPRIEVVHQGGWAVATAPRCGVVRLTPGEAAALADPAGLDDDLAADLAAAGLLDDGSEPLASDGRVRLTRSGIEVDGADRVLQLAYRRGLRRALSAPALAAFGAIGLAGVGALAFLVATRGAASPATADPALTALAVIVIGLASVALHETAHGLVLVHHGRHVRAVGIGCYWGMPTAYVDSSEALLLRRRARIAQALAGPLADVVFAGACSLAALALADTAVGAVLVIVAVTVWLDVAVNAVPLLELDGYWALADLLDRPQLRAEASAAARRFVRHPRRGCGGLALYGVASTAFGVVALVVSLVVWWAVIGDLVGRLLHEGVAGWALAVPLALPTIAAWIGMTAQVTVLASHALRRRRRSEQGPPCPRAVYYEGVHSTRG